MRDVKRRFPSLSLSPPPPRHVPQYNITNIPPNVTNQVPPEQYTAELQTREGATIEAATRTGGLGPFSGPPKALLRVVSQGLFWYLQPRVEKICKVRSVGMGLWRGFVLDVVLSW